MVVGLLACYFVSLGALAADRGLAEAWRELGVPSASPSFLDLRSVTSGWECTRAGVDVLPVNPCDPYRRPANYPSLWMAPARLGLGQESTVLLGVSTALVFFASVLLVMGRIPLREALVYAVALCSPAVMLGVERGNADLLVFAVVVLGLVLFRRGVAGRAVAHGLLVFAAMLKLFPVFAFGVLGRQRRSWALAGGGAALLVFAVYAIAISDELRAIREAVPEEIGYSYGIGVAVDAADAGPLAHVLAGAAGLTVAVWLAWRRRHLRERQSPPQACGDLDAFWAGAGIFAGTFALFNNYDYRLIFLLLTLPQLLRWVREPPPLMPYPHVAVVGVLTALWLGTTVRLPVLGGLWARIVEVFPAEEIVNWLLFAYFAAALLLTRPQWAHVSSGR